MMILLKIIRSQKKESDDEVAEHYKLLKEMSDGKDHKLPEKDMYDGLEGNCQLPKKEMSDEKDWKLPKNVTDDDLAGVYNLSKEETGNENDCKDFKGGNGWIGLSYCSGLLFP